MKIQIKNLCNWLAILFTIFSRSCCTETIYEDRFEPDRVYKLENRAFQGVLSFEARDVKVAPTIKTFNESDPGQVWRLQQSGSEFQLRPTSDENFVLEYDNPNRGIWFHPPECGMYRSLESRSHHITIHHSHPYHPSYHSSGYHGSSYHSSGYPSTSSHSSSYHSSNYHSSGYPSSGHFNSNYHSPYSSMSPAEREYDNCLSARAAAHLVNGILQLFTFEWGKNKFWYLQDAGDGFTLIRNKYYDSLCLQSMGLDMPVQAEVCNNNQRQQWKIFD